MWSNGIVGCRLIIMIIFLKNGLKRPRRPMRQESVLIDTQIVFTSWTAPTPMTKVHILNTMIIMIPTMLKILDLRSSAMEKKQAKKRKRPRVVIPFKTNPAIKVAWLTCLMDPTRSTKSALKFRAKPDSTIIKSGNVQFSRWHKYIWKDR